MDDSAAACAEHENFIAAFAYVAGQLPGGSSRSEGGVVATVSGVALPLFNQVVVEDESASAEAMVEAVEHVRSAGVPWLAVLREGRDDRFIPVLEALGLRDDPDERLPGMALAPIAEPPDPPAELELRFAHDRAEVETHARLNALASDVDPAILAFLADVGLESDPDAVIVVGRLGDRPVATATGFRTGATIGVYSVATVPEVRRRGYGAALTREILRAGRRMGCQVAILQSSAMAVGLYESLGFRTVIRYRAFAPRGADPS